MLVAAVVLERMSRKRRPRCNSAGINGGSAAGFGGSRAGLTQLLCASLALHTSARRDFLLFFIYLELLGKILTWKK